MIRIKKLQCFAQVESVVKKLQAIYSKEDLRMFINLKGGILNYLNKVPAKKFSMEWVNVLYLMKG